MQSVASILDELQQENASLRSAAGVTLSLVVNVSSNVLINAAFYSTARQLRIETESKCAEMSREEFGAFLKEIYDHLHRMANYGEPRERSGCIKVSTPATPQTSLPLNGHH